MWRQIDTLETPRTHQNGNFAQKYFSKGIPKVDLLASKLSHQLPQYFAWKPDPFSQGTDALQRIWGQSIPLRILPYPTRLDVSELGSNRKMLLVKPTWHSQIWYPLLLEMFVVYPLLPLHKK